MKYWGAVISNLRHGKPTFFWTSFAADQSAFVDWYFLPAMPALAEGTVTVESPQVERTMFVDVPTAILLGLGGIVGARIGAAIARRVKGKVIVRALAIALLLVGLRLLLSGLGFF